MNLWLGVEKGLHRGARVRLQAGRHTLGSGSDDDVSLCDDGVVPGHLVLEIDDEGLTVHVAGPGVRLPGHDAALGPGDRVQVAQNLLRDGGQRLSLAEAEIVFEHDDPARGQPGARGAAPRPLPRWHRHPGRAMSAVAAGVLLLVVGVAVWKAPRATPAPIEARAPTPAELQAHFGRTDDWRQLRVVAAPGGRLELHGTVADRRALQEALRLPAFEREEPAVKVIVKDELLRHVQQVLQDPQLQLTVEPASADGEPPRLVVTGVTQRPGLPALLKLLKDEWSGRVEIVDRTSYEPRAGTKRTLRVDLPIRIAAVNVGERYIEAVDGRRYFVGSQIGPEQTVESIDAERVVFNVAGRRIDFQLP